jgi:hypothetical protein
MPRTRSGKTSAYRPSRGQFAGRTFASTHAYRNALAQAKGFRSEHQRRTAYKAVNSRRSLESLPTVSRRKRDDALQVLSIMRREGRSLAAAIREFNSQNPSSHISPKAVKRYAGAGLAKAGQHLHAKAFDRMLRVILLPTARGRVEIEVKDSRSASRIGAYLNAVKEYLKTGDTSQLRKFRGKYITSNRIQYRFITDPETLERLDEFGELSFDSMYEEATATQV